MMWDRLILGRFRDAVLPNPISPSYSGAFFIVFSSDPRRGVYRGRYVTGEGLWLFAASGFVFSIFRNLRKKLEKKEENEK